MTDLNTSKLNTFNFILQAIIKNKCSNLLHQQHLRTPQTDSLSIRHTHRSHPTLDHAAKFLSYTQKSKMILNILWNSTSFQKTAENRQQTVKKIRI